MVLNHDHDVEYLAEKLTEVYVSVYKHRYLPGSAKKVHLGVRVNAGNMQRHGMRAV